MQQVRRKLVAGNWKMHGDPELVAELVPNVLAATKSLDVDVVFFPPYTSLIAVSELINQTHCALGAQSVSEYPEGAYTGEVSTRMLLDIACKFVLVGHSERRSIFGESSADVAAKFVAARQAGLEPVLCVGETLLQRESGETEQCVSQQLQAVFNALESLGGISGLRDAIIAYEPVWAIGTGQTASTEQAQAVHAFIRAQVAELDSDVAAKLRILYGGSVNESNAGDLFAQTDIDGGLIGGASLNADSFTAICRAASLK
ncbi:MAG: triose-phosphate isomerase [Proteobacteria bacterium]|jgi:triosephosphate isomerase (TIM)|nr:triose-phosphate isomerase [Pseudomonadota bacterium]